jgi:hypothetical protein
MSQSVFCPNPACNSRKSVFSNSHAFNKHLGHTPPCLQYVLETAPSTVAHISHTDEPTIELDTLCDEFMHDLNQYASGPELDQDQSPGDDEGVNEEGLELHTDTVVPPSE